jgi:hypothetical protein
MTHLRRMALCCLSVVAIAATSASAASAALPEFVGPIQPFSSTAKKSTLETVGKVKVICTAGTNAGELTGPKTLTVTIRLTGCSSKTIPCNSPNGVAGEIVTAVLTGVLGYISAPLKEAGLDLFSPTGAPITTFGCGPALGFVVTGSVIGKITPVNKLVKPPNKFMLKFTEAKGIQKPMHFEAGPVDILETSINGGPIQPSGLSSTDMLLFAAPLEVKA